jgi:hypothetical protein
MPLFKKIKKLYTGEWFDDLFNFNCNDSFSTSTKAVQETTAGYQKKCPYKIERFEGDCY